MNSHPLDMCIGKDAIRVWAEHRGLRINAVQDGDKPCVPLSRPIVYENGAEAEQMGTIGRFVAVLQKAARPRAGAGEH